MKMRTDGRTEIQGILLGIRNDDMKTVSPEKLGELRYRFRISGEERDLRLNPGNRNETGGYDYPLQNTLKIGRSYMLECEGDLVCGVREIGVDSCGSSEYVPPVSGILGERTVLNFLRTALEPVGTTLYVFGGGWNWQDNGAAPQGRELGVSPEWTKFFREQDASYTYKDRDGDEAKRDPANSYYPFFGYNTYYYAGLDCSGYVGWTFYNTLEAEAGRPGYVCGADPMARRMAEAGWGTFARDWANERREAQDLRPGDVVSMDGHVWISAGLCGDGSAVILHSTPSNSRQGQPGGGVQIGAVGKDTDCEAYRLADRYMTKYYPGWHERYETALKDPELYFSLKGEQAGRFRWHTDGRERGLADPEGIGNMKPEEALRLMFRE